MAAADEVLVLGGGVIGLACAQALQARGVAVRLLERGRIGGETSRGNCGTLTPSHALPLAAPGMVRTALRWMLAPDAPFYVRPRFDPALWSWLLRFARRCDPALFRTAVAPKAALLKASQELLEALVRERGLDCGYVREGLLYAYRDPAVLARGIAHHALLAEHGIVVEPLDAEALQAVEPALRPGLAGGLFFPGDGQLRPERYCAELARVARADGACIEEDAEVVELAPVAAGWRVRLADGRCHEARRLLLATGPWTARMAARLGRRWPIQPGKGYSITYDRPSRPPRRPLVLKDRAVCVTTWADGYRLGSTMEFAGYDPLLNRTRLDALERGAAEYLREPVGPTRREEWYGWRPMTWDDLPLLGPVPGAPGLWVAAGHGMMGVSMSAASAQLIADLVTGRPPLLDPAPYRPERFG
jgi:D-amino-acid dehydrogenase